jgi:hypothetical protein
MKNMLDIHCLEYQNMRQTTGRSKASVGSHLEKIILNTALSPG